MLQKFALAFKSKATEFFAEEDDGHASAGAAEDNIKRVGEEPPAHHHKQQLQRALVSSLFVTVSSFHAAYLHHQAAHELFRLDGVKNADRAAISHLRRLSDLCREYQWQIQKFHSVVLCNGPPLSSTTAAPVGATPCCQPLTSHLEAEVLENQSRLRRFETFFNQLQLEVDQRDAEACDLEQRLSGIEACNLQMERKLATLSNTPAAAVDEGEKLLLSVGVFDTVLREACKAAHRFARTLLDFLRTSGWDSEAMAKSIYPGEKFAKRGHLGYALLSYICLGMFSGFAGAAGGFDDSEERRRDSLRQFVEHCLDDPIDLLHANPDGDFGRFCEGKYHLLIRPEMESCVLGQLLHRGDAAPGLWCSTSPLYEPFVGMCSLVWMLHQLAMAFDRPVEMFQAQRGADFSMVYMENVVERRAVWGMDARRKRRPRVGFTVVPGFRLGGVVIQCRIYVNYR